MSLSPEQQKALDNLCDTMGLDEFQRIAIADLQSQLKDWDGHITPEVEPILAQMGALITEENVDRYIKADHDDDA